MSEALTFLSTGFYALDCALGGGLIVGRVSELYGATADVGAVVMETIVATQASGREVAYLDCSETFDVVTMVSAGVSFTRLLVSTPSTEGQALEIAEVLARGSIALVIVAGEFPETGDWLTDPILSLRARNVTKAVRAIEGICRRTGSHVLFLRGPRSKLTSPVGGNAVGFYASQRVHVKRRTGSLSVATVGKNKAAPAGAAARIRLIHENLTANG